MADIKGRLTISLPGSDMYSSQECEENSKLFVKESITFSTKKKNGKVYSETLNYVTRGSKPAKQSLPIYEDAYNDMISFEGMPILSNHKEMSKSLWKNMSKKARLEFHCKLIAEALGGKVESIVLLED